ncbi:hypothetical protein A4X09_0g128 [Tilletia walkeri]|uniref:Uncharacterized protein n=1 Tax=Tilletia walkeri TaxID=117179 RepID=A0A8X7NFZ1_9BASI|nr:hypothetical protein A4X09_0g128 [Tilletia walkeri]
MPRPTRPLLSFSQSIYLLITLFQAYTYLGLTLLRIKDALPGRTTASSISSAGRRRRNRKYSRTNSFHQHHDQVAVAAAAQAAHLTTEQLQQVLALHDDDDDEDDDDSGDETPTDPSATSNRALIRSIKTHAQSVHAYHTFLHFQRTAGLQPSLTARLPAELVRKILMHAGVPTRRKSRSPYELAPSPVAILSLNRSIHAALLPRIYHSLIIDRPILFRSIRITLSQHLTLASTSSAIQLPPPGVHIRTLHIGSALFGAASTFADLMNSDDDDEDDDRTPNRSTPISTTDDSADSDEEGYLPSHLASPSVLSRGIEQILLDAPHLHTLSLDLYAVSALYTGHPRRFSSSRAPRPRVLRCELAIPQSLSLKLFREVQSVELLCFGMDSGSALELCAALPRGVTELTLRFVRRRRTYAAGGGAGLGGHANTAGNGGTGSAAARARQATRAFFGLGSGDGRGGTISSDSISANFLQIAGEDEGQEEEEEEDDFHSAHEAEEAVRNLAAAVRVLQFSGRSPALFSQSPAPPSTWAPYSSSPSPSPLSHNAHLPGSAEGQQRGRDSFVGGSSSSPFGTPRNAYAVLAGGSPGRPSPGGGSHLPLAPLDNVNPGMGTPPRAFTSLLSNSPSTTAPTPRVSEFFHPDAVPPPNSVIRLHSVDSSWSSSNDESDEVLEDEEQQLGGGSGSGGLVGGEGSSDSAGSLGLHGTGMRRVSEDVPRIEEEEEDEDEVLVGSSAMPIPIPRATRRPEASSWSNEGGGGGGLPTPQRSPTTRRTPLVQSQVFSSSPLSQSRPTTPRDYRADLSRSTRPSVPSSGPGFSSPAAGGGGGGGATSALDNTLPPELTLTHIRVLAWPGALWRLRQLLPDAQRIMDEPSGQLVVNSSSSSSGPFVKTAGAGPESKGKGKAKEATSPATSPPSSRMMGLSGSPSSAAAGRRDMPPAFGPFPASLGLGLDSVHARGPRRGVQELWSRWARQQAGGCAI